MLKKILKSDATQAALAAAMAAYVRLVFRLTRWTHINLEPVDRQGRASRPFIACFWHGRMAQIPTLWRWNMPIHLLASAHRDGRLILEMVRHFGIQPIVGSSSRGGAQAMLTMVQTVRSGGCIALAPDGPRGPRMRVAPGVVSLAKLTAAPIFPVTFSTTYGRVLRTWDRFFLPFPFGRGVVVYGDPLVVPTDADDAGLETARATLETRLNDMTAEADRLCGRTPVAPAPYDPARDAEVAETHA
ncbi:MAG TPA: lysophospholipid acyltransferase family protein [Alphaproteobacteria bacterium]|nr:lysophospholipid acyltransferase family protein [Alphaproteobacteria bacterium]